MNSALALVVVALCLLGSVGLAAYSDLKQSQKVNDKTCIETHPYPNKSDVQIICGKLVK